MGGRREEGALLLGRRHTPVTAKEDSLHCFRVSKDALLMSQAVAAPSEPLVHAALFLIAFSWEEEQSR